MYKIIIIQNQYLDPGVYFQKLSSFNKIDTDAYVNFFIYLVLN